MEQIQFIYFQDYMQYHTVQHKENSTYMEIWHRGWWFKLRPQLPVCFGFTIEVYVLPCCSGVRGARVQVCARRVSDRSAAVPRQEGQWKQGGAQGRQEGEDLAHAGNNRQNKRETYEIMNDKFHLQAVGKIKVLKKISVNVLNLINLRYNDFLFGYVHWLGNDTDEC